MTNAERTFSKGGYIPTGLTEVTVGVGECIIRVDDMRAGRYRCGRRDEAHLKAAHLDGEY